jgi:hypothetical protein
MRHQLGRVSGARYACLLVEGFWALETCGYFCLIPPGGDGFGLLPGAVSDHARGRRGTLVASSLENDANNVVQRTPRTLFIRHRLHSLGLRIVPDTAGCTHRLRRDRRRRTLRMGGEPSGHTPELFSPGSSLHSFEHAGQRVFGGCKGVRGRNGTQRGGTQLTGTQCTGTRRTGTQLTGAQIRGRLTQRNGTRYATDATLTLQVP